MIKRVFKQPLFVIGFLFIALLLAASLGQTVFFDGHVPKIEALHNSKGELTGTPPFSPAIVPPFGTDNTGANLLFKLIQGAKYTISIAIIVACLRIFFSLFIGLFYRQFLMRLNRYFSWMVDAFHYVPMSLIAYFLLVGVLFSNGLSMGFTYDFNQRVFFEFAILTVIAVPTLSIYIGNEAEQINKNEFISSVKLLGGSRIYITRKHIIPLLMPKLVIGLFEQMIQTLILLVHLGLFHLLFGGTQVYLSLQDNPPKYVSISGEWSGLIGNSFQYLFISAWIPMAPLIAFAFAILALKLMLQGIKNSVLDYKIVIKNSAKKTSHEMNITEEKPDFTFVKGA